MIEYVPGKYLAREFGLGRGGRGDSRLMFRL